MKNTYHNSNKRSVFIKTIFTVALLFTAWFGKAQCVASFTLALGPAGSVSFASTSTGTVNPTMYFWYYGDGNTGFGANTVNTYTMNGTYIATLSINSASVCFSSSTVQVVINNIPPCVASFTSALGLAGSASFTSTSTGTAVGTTYAWAFGDGGTAVGPNVAHTYTINGNYTVSLSISNVTPVCSSSVSAVVAITNTAPCLASVTYTLTKNLPAMPAIVWDAFPSYSPFTVAANWSWGDGSNTLGLFPSHTYSAAGFYNICVSTTVLCGATASFCTNNFNIWKTNSPSESYAISKINVIDPLATTIKNNSVEQLSVGLFPNPNNGEFEFTVNGLLEKSVEIKITNLVGQEVYKATETDLRGTINKKINLNELSNGTYFVKVISGNTNYNSKLIINK